MIEVIGARSGDCTISFDGKLLASRIDPRSEAERWCEKHSSELKAIKTVFIIGAGAAYHLSILQNTYPHLKIICIEFNDEIIKQVRNSIEISLLGIEIIHINAISDLMTNEDIHSGLAGSYKVVVHPSSRIHSAQMTRETMLHLNGRLAGGLGHILKARGVSEDVELPEQKPNQLFSLIDLEPVFREHRLSDLRVLQAAMELLK